MSKFLKVMMVVALVAAMVAPAVAEDRLSIGGQMRVRAWSKDDGTNTATYVDQRLRMGGKFSIAEGVSVTFRTDVTENTWGNGGSEFGSGRMPANGMQWDRAHMDLTKGNLHLRAGQQYVGFGMGGTINSQDAGLKFDVKGPVAVSAFWLLDDQRGGTTTADSYLYGLNLGHKTDAYKGNVFFGAQTKAMDADESAYLLGVNVATKLNAISLKGELAYFFGDATATTDAVGTQLFVEGSMAASDAATVGAQLYYALAQDTGEVQYQKLGNDFGGYDPIFALGTSLSNEQITYGRPFDFTGNGAGVIGGRLFGSFKTSDALTLAASLAYLTPEDDKLTTRDSDLLFGAAANYKVMSNTSLQAQVQFISKDDSDNTVEDETQVGVGLFVNF